MVATMPGRSHRGKTRQALFEKNPAFYQVLRDGKPVKLTDLSREELLMQCMVLMDLIERIEGHTEYLNTEVLNVYRNGSLDPCSDCDGKGQTCGDHWKCSACSGTGFVLNEKG